MQIKSWIPATVLVFWISVSHAAGIRCDYSVFTDATPTTIEVSWCDSGNYGYVKEADVPQTLTYTIVDSNGQPRTITVKNNSKTTITNYALYKPRRAEKGETNKAITQQLMDAGMTLDEIKSLQSVDVLSMEYPQGTKFYSDKQTTKESDPNPIVKDANLIQRRAGLAELGNCFWMGGNAEANTTVTYMSECGVRICSGFVKCYQNGKEETFLATCSASKSACPDPKVCAQEIMERNVSVVPAEMSSPDPEVESTPGGSATGVTNE